MKIVRTADSTTLAHVSDDGTLRFLSAATSDERMMFQHLFSSEYRTLTGGSTEISGKIIHYTKIKEVKPGDKDFVKVICADLPRAGYVAIGP